MTRKQLMKTIDQKRIHEAIETAELQTSGEIGVSISPFFWGNVESAANKAFDRLGMSGTKERNGVLFFVVPSRKKFVILGDDGIHRKVGQQFWNEVAAAMSKRFHDGDFTGGLVDGIHEVGDQLSAHFPYCERTDVDELPNTIDFGAEE